MLKIDLGHKINLQRVLCVTIILSIKTFEGISVSSILLASMGVQRKV